MTIENFPDQYPATKDRWAALLPSDSKDTALIRPGSTMLIADHTTLITFIVNSVVPEALAKANRKQLTRFALYCSIAQC
jgi:hypothetical protein